MYDIVLTVLRYSYIIREMAIIRPRLNDFHKLPFTQEEVDFAIPFLDEDLPLYLDPFLLWKSPSLQDNALHTSLTNAFNHLGHLFNTGNETSAITTLTRLSECNEVGLGNSKTRVGKPFGKKVAAEILSLYRDIPQLAKSGFIHFEEIQLLVDNIAKDRVSDIACNLLKSFLIDYTLQQCRSYSIPLGTQAPVPVYNYKTNTLDTENIALPENPDTKRQLLLVPRRWLRFIPWINYDDYYTSCYAKDLPPEKERLTPRPEVLTFNRANYDQVRFFSALKERSRADCKNDPLFSPIPITSATRKFSTIKSLPSGNLNNADKIYEDTSCQLLSSLFYPHLDFAAEQSRTESGSQIRDLIFYNNRSYPFLKDIYDGYACQQIVVEMKNVKSVEREHINQLNRYLKDQFGRFGIILTRNAPSKSILQNTIDLWAGQRKCILILTDDDLKTMCTLFKSKQRNPIDVILKKFTEFTRACPG